MGDQQTLNKNSIYKYIHASQMDTCQLQMGYTVLTPGSSTLTMPATTHARRHTNYMYFNFADPTTRVFHFLGKPDTTRTITLFNTQAVVNPSWSLHCGVHSTNYALLWAMCGELQNYDTLDQVAILTLR